MWSLIQDLLFYPNFPSLHWGSFIFKVIAFISNDSCEMSVGEKDLQEQNWPQFNNNVPFYSKILLEPPSDRYTHAPQLFISH